MKKKLIKALLCSASICCLMGFAACNKSGANTPTPPNNNDLAGYVNTLEVNKKEVTLQAGETFQLTAQTDEGLTISYTSTNEAVATVDATGKISAIGLGMAEIVVSVGDFTQVRVFVKVEQVVVHYHSVELGVSNVNLRVGETFNIDADVYYQGEKVENATLNYASEIEAVATVNALGKITALNTGSTDVVVSYVVDGEIKASSVVSVTIIGEYTMKAELINEKGYFMPGETLSARILSIVNSNNENVNYQSNEVSWISSDPSVVEVINGDITALKSGSAYVTVVYKYGASATFEIKVAKMIYRPSELIAALEAGGTYVLFDDLDMTGYTVKGNIKFDGLLDGNYHEIKNLNRQAGTWSGNSIGEAAFFKEITEGSIVKNIAFTDYTILGMAVQSGFVQTNNGTLENVVLKMFRDTTKPMGWEQPGIGLVCGSVLTWINNGSINDCVVYNLSGSSENYGIAAAVNNGTVDGVYGFIEIDDEDGDDSNNLVNTWNGWRGNCNIDMVWQRPNGGDYDSIVALIGAGSNVATNSVALTGFGDARLASANFNNEFMKLVKSTFMKYEIPQIKIALPKTTPVDLDKLINPTTVNAFGLTFEYEIGDTTLATVEGNMITGVVSGKTNLYVHLKDGATIICSVKMPCSVQQYVLTYNGGDFLDMNKNTTDAVTSLNVKDKITVQDHELSEFNYRFRSKDNNVAVVDEKTGVVTPVADGKTEIYVTIESEEYLITSITVRSWQAISTVAEFAALGPVLTESMSWRHDQKGYFYLTTDLDMTGYVWGGWTTFTGILDGNNHVVSNLQKNGVTWPEGLAGAAAFIGTLNEGSIVRNIGLVNYKVSGGASQGGFVQTNNGTIENVLFMITRDVASDKGWLAQGMGLVCGSSFAWKNNGTIKNCVVHHLLGAEEHYAIAAANNQGTIDGVYGFTELDMVTGNRADNVINTWAGWRGTYNIGIVWTQPNGGDFGSITTTIGVASSNAATNSAALTGFNDATLTAALTSFDSGFAAMVTTHYKAK